MKTADISDVDFLRAVMEANRIRNMRSAMLWDVQTILAGRSDLIGKWASDEECAAIKQAMPWKIVLSKARRLIERRGLLDGCPCGCRGDFELTAKGQALLADTPVNAS